MKTSLKVFCLILIAAIHTSAFAQRAIPLQLALPAHATAVLASPASAPSPWKANLLKQEYNDLTTDDAGFIYVTGNSIQPIPQLLPVRANGYDTTISKIDPTTGATLWQKSEGLSDTGNYDSGKKILIKNHLIYVLAASVQGPLPPQGGSAYTDSAYNGEIAVAKFDLDGSFLGKTILNEVDPLDSNVKFQDSPVDFAIASDGTVYVIGVTGLAYYPGASSAYGDYTWYMAAISPAGTKLWKQTFKGDYSELAYHANNYPAKIFLDANGNPLVVGSVDNTATYYDPAVIRLDRLSGAILEHQVFSQVNSIQAHYLTDVAYANQTLYFAANGFASSGNYGVFTFSVDSNLNLLHQGPHWPSSGQLTNAGSITVASNGNVFFTATVDAVAGASSFGNSDTFIAALSSDLSLSWSKITNGSLNSLDRSKGLALDCQGQPYEFAQMNEINQSTDLMVKSYDALGRVLWDYRYDGAYHRADAISLVKPTSNGIYMITVGAETSLSPTDKRLVRIPAPTCKNTPAIRSISVQM